MDTKVSAFVSGEDRIAADSRVYSTGHACINVGSVVLFFSKSLHINELIIACHKAERLLAQHEVEKREADDE